MNDEPIVTPADIIATLLADAPPLAQQVQNLIEPIRTARANLRDHFLQQGQIEQIEPNLVCYDIGCADGAYLSTQTVVADMAATFAVAVNVNRNGDMSVTGHRTWNGFLPHAADNDTLAKAIMMTHEQALLNTLPTSAIKIIDGSHVTPLIALNIALSSDDKRVRDTVVSVAMEENLPDAVAALVKDELVVACPKSDSSLDLWNECSEHVTVNSAPLPDKALATLILEPGETLKSVHTPPQSWRYLHATLDRVTDARAKIIATRLTAAIQPLEQEKITVHHFKPHGGNTVIRMEMHPGLDFALPDMIASVSNSVPTPHMQEPYAQFLADLTAKNISPVHDYQMDEARLALVESGNADYLDYLTRYRTN